MGAFIWDGDDAWLNQHIFRVEPNDQVVTKGFLLYAVKQAIADLYDKAHGSGMVHVTKPVFEAHQVPLPPLAEQRRIVGKLELLLGKVSSSQQRLSRVPGLLKRFRQSVLAAACSGKLTADWREDSLEQSWNTTELGEIYSLIDGDRGPNYPKQSDYAKSGHCLYLSTKNVRPYGFQFDDLVYISEEKHKTLKNGTLSVEDVVITTRGTLGNVAYFDSETHRRFPTVRINSGMLIMRPKGRQIVTPRFLHSFIASPLFSSELAEKQSGSAQPQIPAGILKSFSINIPPLSEQQEIVRRVEKLFAFADQIEARLRQAQAHVDRLTQSLLAKAFRGELVPTEHALATRDGRDYEPAGALLERLRAEPARATIKSKRSSRKSIE